MNTAEHLVPIRPLLERFMEMWIDRPETVGVYLIGSWALNRANEHSDIDLRVVIKNECLWTEKQSYLWEDKKLNAWAMSANQLSRSLIDQWRNFSRFDARTLSKSVVLSDDLGVISALRKEADLWVKRPFEPVSDSRLMLMCYEIKGGINELKQKKPEEAWFFYDYFQIIDSLKKLYLRKFGLEEVIGVKFFEKMSEPGFCDAYLLPELPHEEFRIYLKEALGAVLNWDDGRALSSLEDFVLSFLPPLDINNFSLKMTVHN